MAHYMIENEKYLKRKINKDIVIHASIADVILSSNSVKLQKNTYV